MRDFTRREFIKTVGAAGTALCVLGPSAGCLKSGKRPSKRTIVLGFDGMDPGILRTLAAKGEMPNAARLMAANIVLELGTSTPPQSPVAWADFISGANPGYHGIFDFIQRKPDEYTPYFSMSEAYSTDRKLNIGSHIIPIGRSGMKLLRRGEAFWNILEKKGFRCAVFRVPSNFPPQESKSRTFAGMGTPDLRGGYGTFSYYTTDPSEAKPDITGGTVTIVSMKDGSIKSHITGPNNQFEKNAPESKIEFSAYPDVSGRVARIDIQGEQIILKPGEWSEWQRLEFPALPGVSTHGIALFYLKEIKPNFRLYISPVNIDPIDPALPLSTPPGLSRSLAEKFGPFYTAGMPEDTKALNNGILTDSEYLHQAGIHHSEQRRIFSEMLASDNSDFLFYYFSDTDLGSHMFWSSMDPNHSCHAERDPAHRGAIFDYYKSLDAVLGQAMASLAPDDTIFVISDHGFAPYSYSFNLNTWLMNKGFAALTPDASSDAEFLMSVDWGATRAYALGFNALYVNQSGREKLGNVSNGEEKDRLLDEITAQLLATVDEATGMKPVSSVYRSEKIYRGPAMKNAPDLIIGYNRGYRASWETAIGKFPENVIEKNTLKWSGDHCIDPVHVPGIVLCNKRIKNAKPMLRDIPATVLSLFGQPVPPWMQGRNIL